MCNEQRLTKEAWAAKQYPECYRNGDGRHGQQRTLSCSEIPKGSLSPPPQSPARMLDFKE